MVERTRTLPGLGLGLGVNPYLDPASLLNSPDPSQDTSVTGNASPATAGSGFGEGLGSWLGALGMALLSSPRNAPFATLPDIMPAVMQQSQLRAAAAQQAKLAQMAPSLFHPQGAPSIEDLLGGASPMSPPGSNVGGGQAPQYPGTGDPNLLAGGALTGTGLGHVAPKAERVAFARDYAASKGLNPDAIVATMAGEGLNKYVGDGGTSFGDLQLHVGGGMGDQALSAGIDIRNPNTWQEQTKFAIDQMAANRDKGAGWYAGQWHGAPAWAARSFNQPTTTALPIGGLPAWQVASDTSQEARARFNPTLDNPKAPPVQLAQAGPQTMTDASPQMRPNPFADQAAAPPPYPATGSDTLSAGGAFNRQQNAPAPAGPLPSSRLALDLQPQQVPAAPAASPPPQSSAPATQSAPTPQQVQQAQAFVQRPPPPSPDTVGSDLAKQRAAAIRYYKYYGDLALRLAPFGAAGKPYVDAANKQMDLAKELLTEGQKKQLEATYAFPIAQGTASGSHAGALPYLPAEKQIEQQAQYFGPGADVGLQQQLDRAKAQEQAAANTQEHMATQYGLQYDPRNPNAGVSPIPNFSALNAANKGAEAASVANAQMPAKVGEQTASEYSKLGAEDIFKRRPLALDAAESLRQSQVARNLIGAGINTGPFDKWKQSFDRVLGDNNIAANTEAFIAARATEVGRLIKQFGSGTGLSDADREYAAQMAAGRTSLTKQSILTILDLNDTAARNVLQRYNQDAAQVPGGLVPYPLTVQPAQNTAAAPTSQQQGAAPVAPPPGGVAIGTYQGRPVYRMPDGSRKVLQ